MIKKPEQGAQPGERNLGKTLLEVGVGLALLQSRDLYVTFIGAGFFLHGIFGDPIKGLIAYNKEEKKEEDNE